MKYGFIGVGHMGGAILRGFLKSGAIAPEDAVMLGHTPEKTENKARELGITPAVSGEQLTEMCDVIFVGVVPQVVPQVLESIMPALSGHEDEKIIVSMAAGVTISSMEKILGESAKIIRIMPNAPAEVGEIMVSISGNRSASTEDIELVKELFDKIGEGREVDESLIDAVIGVSGSSPAYTYMYIRALAKCGVDNGMKPGDARVFAAQAVLGAAKLALKSDQPLDEMIDKICTKGGTTEAAVKVLSDLDFEGTIEKGAQAAADKSAELSGKK